MGVGGAAGGGGAVGGGGVMGMEESQNCWRRFVM